MHFDAELQELLETLGPKGRRLVAHVVRCDVCRVRLLMALEEEVEPEAWEAEEGRSQGLYKVLEVALDRAVQDLGAEELQAEESLRELAGLPAGAAWETVAGGKALRNSALALRLLPDELATGGEPELTEERAHLVLAIGATLDERGGGQGAAECAGRGWSALGEIERRRGELRRAAKAFGMAAEVLEPTELSAGERALFCRLLARLRLDQGRTDEALGLLERACGFFSSPGAYSKMGEALADKGWLLMEELDLDGAALALRAAVNLIDPQASPWEAVRARQGLALCNAERGRGERVLGEWWGGGGWPPKDWAWSELDRLRLSAMSAEIEERSGRPESAARLLRSAVEGLVEQGELYEAAVATAALLRLLTELGEGKGTRTERLRDLLAPLARDEYPWAVLSFLFDQAAGASTQIEASEIFRVGGEYLDRARHNPKLAYHPRWRPRAVMSWESLAEASREEACRLAWVSREAARKAAEAIGSPTRCRLAWVYEAYTEIRILFVGRGEAEEGIR